MQEKDHSFDLVIIGSGGGGLVAALAAADVGLRPLILEKLGMVGGSTAMSGGVIWMPNNPLMRAAGVQDSHADGMAYLEAVVGDIGRTSSPEKREAFLTAGLEMIDFLLRKGLRFQYCAGYSDYYSNYKGGKAEGRSIEGLPFDTRQLGDWQDKLPPGFSKAFGLVMKTNEFRLVPYFNRSPKALSTAARVWLRTKASQLRKEDLVTNGSSLVGQLLQLVVAADIPLWLNTAVEELVVEEGRVVGVRAVREGSPVVIEASKGVLLSAGGFAHNTEMRRKYGGDHSFEAEWSIANPGDTGEMLNAAIGLGAKVDLMEMAIWNPGTRPELGASSLALGRNRPGTIYVDPTGRRFCNEANDPLEVCRAMYDHNAVPCWLIFDDGYRRRYAATALSPIPGRYPAEWFDRGYIKKAATLEDLAGMIGIDSTALVDTIRRFNANAKLGLDPDFSRGQSAFNRCFGDPAYKPNPALGPLEKPPYYATEIFPSDVGTCGGVVTNEYAQVVDDNYLPIPGLYATGNITATLMGRSYPGAGASIADTTVFGYVAARHAANRLTMSAAGKV